MTRRHPALLLLALTVLGSGLALAPAPAAAQAAAATDPADAALLRLVDDFLAAERAFDAARLATLVTPDYAEVSPLGELDLRDRFLGFYAPDRRTPVPPTTLSDPLVRRWAGTASVIARLSFEVPGPGGQPRSVSMRASFLAIQAADGWKIASAHYTPERPKGPPSPPPPPHPAPAR